MERALQKVLKFTLSCDLDSHIQLYIRVGYPVYRCLLLPLHPSYIKSLYIIIGLNISETKSFCSKHAMQCCALYFNLILLDLSILILYFNIFYFSIISLYASLLYLNFNLCILN